MSDSLSHLSARLTRRDLTLAAAVAGIGLTVIRPTFASAQGDDLTTLGLPTLDITVDDTSFTGVPESVPAGRYLVNLTINVSGTDGATLGFISPYGMTSDEFFAFLGIGADSAGGDEASPDASPASDDGGGDDNELLPAFVYQSHWAGGAFGLTGTVSSVIDLTEGDWIAWGDEPSAPQAPVAFKVSGAAPDTSVTPASDITFTLVDFAISVDGNLTAGDHTILVQNNGAQPHFIVMMTTPDEATDEDLSAYFESTMTGTPAALPYNPEEVFMPFGYVPTQSIGTSTWHSLTLGAGAYVAMCFFPTAGVGDEHALHGMHKIFKVT